MPQTTTSNNTTILEWLKQAENLLASKLIPSARLDAEVLLAHALKKDRSWLIAHSNDIFGSKSADSLLERRLTREPVAYIVGHKEFYGREFIVTPDVLIPRPETENLIELAKKHRLSGRLLDVGTGSGCIGITLALENNMELFANDLSEDALEVAMKNATRLGVRGVFSSSHLVSRWSGHIFDVIVANLPYVNPDWERSPETDHEPTLALFARDNGLGVIKELIEHAPARLKPSGYLLLEADPEQHPDIIAYSSGTFRLVEEHEYGLLLQRV